MRRPARRPFAIRSTLRLLLLAAACGSAGCIPVKQYNVTGVRAYDNFGYADGGYGELKLGGSNAPRTATVVDAESYAIAPNGTRYGIQTVPERRRNPDSPLNVGDRVYLVRPNGRRTTREWADGYWEFYFTLDTPYGRDFRHLTVEFWTFVYVAFVHRTN